MKKRHKRLIRAARKTYRRLSGRNSKPAGADPVILQPYRGFTNGRQFFIKGRVLEDKNIQVDLKDSIWRNLLNSFKRFDSDELPNVKLKLNFNNQDFHLNTDEEGYFALKTDLNTPLPLQGDLWRKALLELMEAPKQQDVLAADEVQLLYPEPQAEFGVISDIDDTVLRTYVTSTLGLRMLYATLMWNAHQRKPVEGMAKLLQALAKKTEDKIQNPVFYVSNSPWNFYDVLVQFIELQQLPKGPVLLRDYGLAPTNFSTTFRDHKEQSISHILEMYPNMKFIFLGDTGSKDVDHYLNIARKYPEQILSVYIRRLRYTANVRRVEKLIASADDIDLMLVKNTREIWQDAVAKKYINVK